MSVIDDFTSYHEELLEGQYDCVDRIVVKAYFEYAQSAGGFRRWWRILTGSDETLDRAHLERMAGRFKRRLEAYAKKNKIPFLYCEAGERKQGHAERKSAFGLFSNCFIKSEQVPSLRKAA